MVTTEVIHLDENDDIVSIRDRLEWAKANRVVLVLPDKGDLLIDYLDLSFVRRQADKLRITVGLVTVDNRVTNQARELGIPTFRTIADSKKRQRRWWRGQRARMVPGKPTQFAEADRQEVKRRSETREPWQVWLMRYGAVLIFVLTFAVVFVAAVYAVPAATITLKPKIRDLEVNRSLLADPQLDSASDGGSSVIGRQLATVREWEAEVETTGQTEVADSTARGSVLFVNELAQPASVPAGTRVSTSIGNRTIFQTIENIDVPSGVGSSAEVDIVAVEPGTAGNVGAGLINRIEGPLGLQLAVRNLSETSGGQSRLEPAVTEADIERLRAQVIQQLQFLALSDFEAMLADSEFLAKDSIRVGDVLHETYSHFPGEQTSHVALDIRAELSATAVDANQAAALMYEELAKEVPPGYQILPDSLEFESGEVLGVDQDGRVLFDMIGRGRTTARVDLDNEVEEIAGQPVGLATVYLYERLPLSEYPHIKIWPGWFERIPYLPVRISTEIVTSNE